jgi:uncharacterized membrane protein
MGREGEQAMAEAMARPSTKSMSIVGHPIYSMLLPVPVVCFVGALLTDLAYICSGGNLVWLNFTSWLLLAGLVFGFVAALVLLIDVIRSPAVRTGVGWTHLLVFYAALIVELVSMFIHQRDGWTAVAGAGLILSIIGAVLMLIAGWLRRPAVGVVR